VRSAGTIALVLFLVCPAFAQIKLDTTPDDSKRVAPLGGFKSSNDKKGDDKKGAASKSKGKKADDKKSAGKSKDADKKTGKGKPSNK